MLLIEPFLHLHNVIRISYIEIKISVSVAFSVCLLGRYSLVPGSKAAHGEPSVCHISHSPCDGYEWRHAYVYFAFNYLAWSAERIWISIYCEKSDV